jgi:hypothetical protein
MALVPTLVALIGGIALGLRLGGRLDLLARFHLAGLPLLTGAIAAELLIRSVDRAGGWTTWLHVIAYLAVLVVVWANIRIPGMAIIGLGVVLNLVPTLVNGGMPTSRWALEKAGLLDADAIGSVVVSGPRHVAGAGDSLRFLGEVIPVPTGQVLSLSDVIVLIGLVFLIAGAMRGRRIRTHASTDYRRDIAPLGRGPAPRRGPALHPAMRYRGPEPPMDDEDDY